METHTLIQGTPEWHAFRQQHHGASEAAAMLGLSKKTSRSELLRMKKTGLPKEFSDWVQKNILDYGHEVEAAARPLIERIVGETLYPATCSEGKLSASLDGVNMADTIIFEHKQWAEDLAESVRAGVLPEEHMPQCQQELLVVGAEKVIFAVSDGTPDKLVWMEVHPDQAWFDRIRAGWEQFDRDLADYVVPEAAPVVTATPVEGFGALVLQVEGRVVSANLDAFRAGAEAFIARLPKPNELQTDQDFANADAAVKACSEAEARIKSAKEAAQAQMFDVDAVFRAADLVAETIRVARLALEKAVKAEKEARRTALVEGARSKFAAHLKSLQVEFKDVQLSVPTPDFGAAIKGLKSLDSMQDKLDTAVANGKIAANELATDIRGKLAWFNDNVAEDHRGLFRDLNSLIGMPPEHFQTAVIARVQQHQQAQATRDEKIRQEAAAKALAQAHPANDPQVPVLSVRAESPRQQAPSVGVEPRPGTIPTLKLGQIVDRIAPLSVTADGLASLGFPHAGTDKNAKLYHETDFPAICDALIEHINAARRGAAELLAA